MRQQRRVGLTAVAIGIGFVVLSACGGSSDDTGGTPTATVTVTQTQSQPPSQPPTTAAGPPSAPATTTLPDDRCTTSDLAGSLKEGEPGAGQRYARLILTNTSDELCTIYGYGGAELQTANGDKLPTNLVRDESTTPTTVALAPGAAAQSQLHWGIVNGTGDNPGAHCQPDPGTLAVIPPDETTALDIPWTFGMVCEQGRIDQLPYVPAGG